MKRIMSALLCAVMLLCILPVPAFAQDKVTPIILVQGYSGPALFYDLGGENEHQVWGINMDDLKKIVIARIPSAAICCSTSVDSPAANWARVSATHGATGNPAPCHSHLLRSLSIEIAEAITPLPV